MSRLDDLIAELCPDGVKYRKIGDFASVKRGVRVVRNQLSTSQGYPVYQNSIEPLGYYHQSNCKKNFTYIIGAGAAGKIGFSYDPFWAADDCYYVDNSNIIHQRFLFHVLLSQENFIYSKVRKASVPRLSRISIENLVIPIPPFSIQEEIVQILDTFSELTKELTIRKKQYQYYRDKILSFDENFCLHGSLGKLIADLCHDGVTFHKLGNICEIRSGWTFPNAEQGKKEGDFPFFKVADMNIAGNEVFMNLANNYIDAETARRLKCRPAPKGTVIFPKIGAAIGTNKKRMLVMDSCYDNNVIGLIAHDSILPGFLFHTMQTVDLMRFADFSGAVPSIRKSTLEKFEIKVPSLPVQEEAVRILDAFSAIVNDLSSGLPAEIEARRKQYEHYRDRLLAFKEREA